MMKNYMVTCAVFFCASMSVFGSEDSKKFESTTKSISTAQSTSNTQRALKEQSPPEKLSTAFALVSKIVGKELKKNGINTCFMEGKHEPSIDIVKQSIPAKFGKKSRKNHNLIELTYHYWKFNELSHALLKLAESTHMIDFDVIHKAVQAGLSERRNFLDAKRVPVSFSAKPSRYEIQAYLPKDSSLQGYFCQYLGDNVVKLTAVSGPSLLPSNHGDEKRILYWEEVEPKVFGDNNAVGNALGAGHLQGACAERAKEFNKLTGNYLKDILYSDDKNIRKVDPETYFLNAFLIAYRTVMSLRLNGFDFNPKDRETDIPADELKRRQKIALLKLENRYLRRKLKTHEGGQLNNSGFQSNLRHTILENDAKVYALNNCPTMAALKASIMKGYEQLGQLQNALASLEELSNRVISLKMEENMEHFMSTFYGPAKKG